MNEKQQKAIFLIASGKSGVEIAKLIDVTPKTISTWRKSPEFQAELNSYLAEIKQANSERLRSMGILALDTVEQIMTNESVAVKERLSAAFKILDHARVYPQQIKSSNSANLKLDNMFN